MAKRPQKVYDYQVKQEKRASKRVKRNLRLRQTYFAANFNNLYHSIDLEEEGKKRPKLKDTTIDMYFPARGTSDEDMQVECEE